MSRHRRNGKEMKIDRCKATGDMAEHKPTRSASNWMKAKPYSKHTKAGDLIKAQGQQMEVIDILEYLRRTKIVKGNR